MAVVVEGMWQRPRPEQELADLFSGGWPAFIHADERAAQHLPAVRERFGDLEVALVQDGRLVAAGWGVPIAWDGKTTSLPGGYSETLARAVSHDDADATRDCFVICAAQVHPDLVGRGLATTLLEAMVGRARDRGSARVIAPLRPTLKRRYPLTPIEQYATWTRADGEPLDPWLRLHTQMGASVLATTDSSQVFTGTVAEWEDWAGLALPSSGVYVLDDALAPLHVDRDAGRGTCVEPGIWVQHR